MLAATLTGTRIISLSTAVLINPPPTPARPPLRLQFNDATSQQRGQSSLGLAVVSGARW